MSGLNILGEGLDWCFPNMNIRNGSVLGGDFTGGLNSGVYFPFSGAANKVWISNYSLENNEIEYDGSDLEVTIKFQLTINAGAGENIKINVNYMFTSDGDNLNGAGTNFTDTIDITGKVLGEIITVVLPTKLIGVVNKKDLQFNLKRFSNGVGSDTYPGDLWCTSIQLKKAE